MNGNCDKTFKDEDINDDTYIDFLKCKENNNIENLKTSEKNDILYPHFNDPNFNEIIFTKKEFNDNKYIENKEDDYREKKLIKISEYHCNNKDFELDPHQLFVKNFLSMNTPYNSLLLYHGLGTGKTCSAITICEEMRKYYDLMGFKKKIIIICSKQLQENFRNQIFNPDKLPENPINGYWKLKTCVGSKLLKEINPTNIRNLSREKVIRYINKIIKTSYGFYGYIEFKNRMYEVIFNGIDGGRKILKSDSPEIINEKIKYNIKLKYSNCTLVIDEIHNLRVEKPRSKMELKIKYKGDDDEIKKQEKIDKESAEYIKKLVTYSKNLKLLLLSATPMFNKNKEIIWLLNILNLNDGRYPLEENDIFKKDGNIHEAGKELLLHKSSGYISYIRGNNPFTFPHKIFPNLSNSTFSLYNKVNNDKWKYPIKQMNNKKIIFNDAEFKLNDAYDLKLIQLSKNQNDVYNNYINHLFETKGEKFSQYEPDIQTLGGTKQILNIVYSSIGDKISYGKNGLKKIMEEKIIDKKKKYNYKDGVDKVFRYENIGNYSSKIKHILDTIKNSQGIVLIYSQYIYAGCIPMALALEEVGFESYSSKNPLIPKRNLLKADLEKSEKWRFKKGKTPKYIMITGKTSLTGSVKRLMNAVVDNKNKNGDMIKVVIISAKGSEGLDFKNIRQVHIMDPWYNFNRIEQIIGRAVRKLSHCNLPYNKRNVEIFLYGSLLQEDDVESCDLYLYRLSKRKSNQIGEINRLLKKNAVDCLLNRNVNFNKESEISQTLSSNFLINPIKIKFNIKDVNGSGECDYMDCNYDCFPKKISEIDKQLIKEDTYNLTHINNNKDIIIKKIKYLFKEKYIYDKKNLIMLISPDKKFSIYEIDNALNYLIKNKEVIFDLIDSEGYLINIRNKYLFQPINIENKNTSYYNRIHKLLNNKKYITVGLKNTQINPERKNKIKDIYKSKKFNVVKENSVSKDKLYEKLYSFTNILSTPQEKGNKDWMDRCSRVIENMIQNDKETFEGDDISRFKNILIILALQREILLLNVKEKIKLLNTYNDYVPNDDNAIIWKKILKNSIAYFFSSIIININGKKYCILNKNSTNLKNFVLKNNKNKLEIVYHDILFLEKTPNEWIPTAKDLNLESKIELKYRERYKTINKYAKTHPQLTFNNLNQIFGFIRSSHRNKEYEFFYTTKKKPKQRNALKSITKRQFIKSIFNKIKDKYEIRESTVKIKGGKKIQITQDELNIEFELTLRYYNFYKKDGKIWFLNPYDDYLLKNYFGIKY